MIIRNSQNIRQPERKPTAFGEKLKAALEAQQSKKERPNA
jgi:hypothetical protein